MHYLAIISSLLLASGVVASPTSKRLAARGDKTVRQAPAPSSYPGGDYPACTNEFQYLNFDVSNNEQLIHVQAVHQAFCTGWPQLLVNGYENLQDTDTTIFARFFSNDADTNSEVGQVYSSLVDTSNGTPQPITASMILDNNDWLELCPESGGTDPDDDDAVEEGGYQGVDPTDSREKFHLCNSAYENFATIPSDNGCTLDDYPDALMESLSRLVLHEMLHYTTVGPPIFGSQIVDGLNDDTEFAYYPQRAHGLVDPNQDDNAGAAVTNADSYGWHATNSYYKYACNNVEEPGPNGGNWNDPPAYTDGTPGDAD